MAYAALLSVDLANFANLYCVLRKFSCKSAIKILTLGFSIIFYYIKMLMEFKICKICCRRDILAKTAPHLVEAISSYRGGYIAEVHLLFNV